MATKKGGLSPPMPFVGSVKERDQAATATGRLLLRMPVMASA
jgi:hypothetical protein